MPLYLVQDEIRRPLYIIAPDWNSAYSEWKVILAAENEIKEYQGEPDGIQKIADDDELVINGVLQKPLTWIVK